MSPRFFALQMSTAMASGAAAAQDAAPVAEPGQVIEFSADTLVYDSTGEVATAIGHVVVTRDDYRLSANEVSYDRKTGAVEARGAVEIVDPRGNHAYAQRVDLTESLRDGAVSSFLLILQDGGRLAAGGGQRINGVEILNHAVYSPCDIIGKTGCPKRPLWQIKADRVRHDAKSERIFYKNARLEVLNIPVFFLPGFSHPDGPGRNASGVLVPDVKLDRSLGGSVELPYFLSFSPSSDLTLTPTVYTRVNPLLGVEYRQLTGSGPIRFGGAVTYSSELDFPNPQIPDGVVARRRIRGYLYGNGQLQHSEAWRSTFGLRLASDDTFLRRYDISHDDTLRNFYRLERLGVDSYFALEGWAFQGLRRVDAQGMSPIVLPLVDLRIAPDALLAGGRVDLRANTAEIARTGGMDTRRASASAEWTRSIFTGFGQRVTATGLLRGDVYNVNDGALAQIPQYGAPDGWHGRFISAAALDVEWPLAGPAFGGIQTITPRVQLSLSNPGQNADIPNEDARAVDLDDTNLFDISRFPGFDRWEGGGRVTYGASWRLDRPRWTIESEFGQSYRFRDNPGLFPKGTGLSGNFSDFVGRNTLRFASFVDLTHRFRLDKSTLKLRRNEVDVTVGGSRTYATVGYVKLNRDIDIEDLQDREELRAGGRLQIARYWSVFGSVIADLTSASEDPLNASDGFQLIRHRIGVAYADECFEFGLTWRRDYVEDRDFRRGNTFLFHIVLKNLGR